MSEIPSGHDGCIPDFLDGLDWLCLFLQVKNHWFVIEEETVENSSISLSVQDASCAELDLGTSPLSRLGDGQDTPKVSKYIIQV